MTKNIWLGKHYKARLVAFSCTFDFRFLFYSQYIEAAELNFDRDRKYVAFIEISISPLLNILTFSYVPLQTRHLTKEGSTERILYPDYETHGLRHHITNFLCHGLSYY